MGNSMGSVDMDLLVHTLEKMEFDQKTANQLNVSTIVGRSMNMQLASSAGVCSWGHVVVEQEKSNLDAALRSPPVLMSNCDRQYMDPSTNFAEAVDTALEADLQRLASNQKVAIKKALKRLVKAGALTQVGGQYKLVKKAMKAGISKQRLKSVRTPAAKKRTSSTPLRAPPTPWNPVGAFDVSTVPPTPPPAPKFSTLDDQMAKCASLTNMTSDSPLSGSESKLQARGTKAFLRMMQAQQTLQQMDKEADDRVAPAAEFQLIEEAPEPMLETQPLAESIDINISTAQLVETVTGADEVAPALIERVDMSIPEASVPEARPSQEAESDKQLIGVLERMDRAAAAKERMKSAKRQLAMFAKTPMKLGTEFVMMKDVAEVIKACVPERVLSPSVHAMNVA